MKECQLDLEVIYRMTADADAYNAFLDEFLFDLPCISRIRTNLVLREGKRTTELPL